ncbi:MAG: hypothetical protein ACD_19C00091G0003 [uncultured bacterium]|nr:MAG: hypothetical protein ACD_19C00091G0003 [uncultured bacterium]
MEDKNKRLKRFQNGPPIEVMETLLNSLVNYFNREINQAATLNLWTLVILGIHAVALTITEGIFGKKGLTGFTFFLKSFIDSTDDGCDFSTIAADIHQHRNIIAHQWLSVSGYHLGYDFEMKKGWDKRGDTIFFNPIKYHALYKKAFSASGKIWKYENLLSEKDAVDSKNRLIEKYERR